MVKKKIPLKVRFLFVGPDGHVKGYGSLAGEFSIGMRLDLTSFYTVKTTQHGEFM